MKETEGSNALWEDEQAPCKHAWLSQPSIVDAQGGASAPVQYDQVCGSCLARTGRDSKHSGPYEDATSSHVQACNGSASKRPMGGDDHSAPLPLSSPSFPSCVALCRCCCCCCCGSTALGRPAALRPSRLWGRRNGTAAGRRGEGRTERKVRQGGTKPLFFFLLVAAGTRCVS
jgi:hypothetical protein